MILKDVLQIRAASGRFLHNDAKLVVHEETHEEEHTALTHRRVFWLVAIRIDQPTNIMML